jgi:uncharacterized protein YjiK
MTSLGLNVNAVTMDNNGSIFIVCIDSESIFEMSQDGIKVARMLSKKDYLKRPYVIQYLNDGSFLVSNESGRSVVRYKQNIISPFKFIHVTLLFT